MALAFISRWLLRAVAVGAPMLAAQCLAAEAQPDTSNLIEAGASQNYFHIEPNFDGTSVVLFGAIDRERIKDRPFDLAITIRGPEQPLIVWKKARHFGIWINASSVTFEAVPSFYAVISTKPLETLAPLAERKNYEIGIDSLPLPLRKDEKIEAGSKELSDFRDALIRIKSSNGVFTENTSAIEFIGKTLFRAKTFLPASAGPGLYRARIFLLQNGKVIGSTTSQLHLQKIGIEAFLSQTSSTNPWLYGASAVLLAAAVGGGTSLVFRRR